MSFTAGRKAPFLTLNSRIRFVLFDLGVLSKPIILDANGHKKSPAVVMTTGLFHVHTSKVAIRLRPSQSLFPLRDPR